MKNTSGNLSQKTLSKNFQIEGITNILEVFALFGLGALAIVLHIKMKTPLHLPGHHGLEFMALLMLGRYASKMPLASSISSFGAGFMLFFPIWAGKDPFAGIIYMLPGFILDFLYYKIKENHKLWLIALLGGLSYAIIPVVRFVIMSFTGIKYGALLTGLAYPFFTFTLFGALGSLFGASLMKQILNKLQKK